MMPHKLLDIPELLKSNQMRSTGTHTVKPLVTLTATYKTDDKGKGNSGFKGRRAKGTPS